MKSIYLTLSFLCLSMALISLQGCAPAIVAGSAAGAASVASDKRSAGTIINDQAVEFRVASKLQSDDEMVDKTNISVTAYNGVILLTGEAPTQELKDRAYTYANEVADDSSKEESKIKQIHNEISIREPLPFKARNYDTWLTTKIKTKLLTTKDVSSFEVKVVTSDTTVYLLGFMNRQDADTVTRVIANIQGVTRIVKAFEYTD